MAVVDKMERLLSAHRLSALISLSSLCWTGSIFGFFYLRYVDVSERAPWIHAIIGAFLAIVIYIAIGLKLHIFQGGYIIGSKDEIFAITKAVGLTALILFSISNLWPSTEYLLGQLLPQSTVIAGSLGSLVSILGVSMLIRMRRESSQRPRGAEPALIFGAGSAGQQLIDSMLTDASSPYLPVGILDDDASSSYIRIRNIPYFGGRANVAEAVKKTGATTLIIALAKGPGYLYRELNAAGTAANLVVKTLPPLGELVDGRVGFRDLNSIDINDLLGRQQIDTNVESIAGFIAGKRVLVTGAGGSIGSELCRQLRLYDPAELMMLDRDESALHSLQLSLEGRALLDTSDTILADIRDSETLNEIFENRMPQVVFHAAALKHLPMLEKYPTEAWKTNVLGTLNVLEAAKNCGTEVFVNISTDKAASPSSVLGHAKRLAERLTSTFGQNETNKFVSVRFGNVLGSRGSVLTTFANQVASGGPVTVTHPEITRYFMTIPEAVQLVIQSGALGENGDVLVLDMGTPVKIVELAKQVIELSHADIAIEFTGLRSGEKLHEELFSSSEVPRETSHSLISRVQVPHVSIASIRNSELKTCTDFALFELENRRATT